MALRIRRDGTILCAALHEEAEGDLYIDDGLHYQLSVVHKLLVTEPEPFHSLRGEWWWKGHEPEDVQIEDFYYD